VTDGNDDNKDSNLQKLPSLKSEEVQ
jgi:hypothetical protein